MGSSRDPGDPDDADEPVLSPAERTRRDPGPDAEFYDEPRYVTHVDDEFLTRLTRLYRDYLADGAVVFDAMSSWRSHLPVDVEYERVVGHGMNEAELAENPRLDAHFVQDFNRDQSLPLADGRFDAVTCALSVQYLQYPTAVVREFGRVLRPGGVLVVAFSNRLFPTKAIRKWRRSTMDERAELVCSYVEAAGGFEAPIVVRDRSTADPFYAVVARRAED